MNISRRIMIQLLTCSALGMILNSKIVFAEDVTADTNVKKGVDAQPDFPGLILQ